MPFRTDANAADSETGEAISINTNDRYVPDPTSPYLLVMERFEAAKNNSENMLAKLTEEDGYLDQMAAVIGVQPDISALVPPNIDDTITLVESGLTVPDFDANSLGVFPDETYALDALAPLPEITTTSLDSIVRPAALSGTEMNWAPTTYSHSVLTALVARILNDIQTGETGINAVAEQAIYDRAQTRQQADRVAAWDMINETAGNMQYSFPPGVLLSGLTDFSIGATRQDADIENTIIVNQTELAQKNSQFIIQQSVALENLLITLHNSSEDRLLDYEKSRVDVLVKVYAENVKGYLAELDGEKTRIQAMTEALRGVLESNKAKVEIYKEQYSALAVRIDAVAKRNDSLVKTFLGEVQAFSEVERATSSKNESLVKYLTARIAAADLDLRAAIAKVEAQMSGYAADMNVRERIATAMANIASQTVASWASAVNASAGLSYSAGESISESRSQSKSISVTHNYPHMPLI